MLCKKSFYGIFNEIPTQLGRSVKQLAIGTAIVALMQKNPIGNSIRRKLLNAHPSAKSVRLLLL